MDTEDRFFNLIFPKQAVGSYIDEDSRESGIILTGLLLFMIVCGIVSTLTYLNVFDKDNVSEKTKDLTLSAAALSWVLFVSFLFLIFGATRLFHIFLFIALLASAGYAYKGMEGKTDQNMMLTVIILGAISTMVLIYYLTLSRTVTDAIEYREKERLARLHNKYKDRIERIREQSDENLVDIRKERDMLREELELVNKEKGKLEEKMEKKRQEKIRMKKKIRSLEEYGVDTDSD